MNRIYNKDTYMEERNYLDWYSMSALIRQCELTLNLAIEEMDREIKGIEEYKPEIKTLTSHLHNTLETMFLCTDRMHELCEYCEANSESEYIK